MRVIERTPLEEVDEVEVDLLKNAGPPLIEEILQGLAGPPGPEPELRLETSERARGLRRLRKGERAPTEIPRDLAALQSLLIESLRRDIPERRSGDFAQSVERLAEIFGSIQATLTEGLVRDRAGTPHRDELTGLPGSAELDEWMRILIAEQSRYEHPFAVALIDIEGLARINDAYGREAGDRMVSAVATVVRNQIRTVDQAFRIGDDEFCVLAPHTEAPRAQQVAERLVQVFEASQADEGPRLAIAVGISACPEHGDDARRLLDSAEEATYAAKAAGRSVAIAASNGGVSVKDR